MLVQMLKLGRVLKVCKCLLELDFSGNSTHQNKHSAVNSIAVQTCSAAPSPAARS
jgi:hypothetical protein